MAKNYQFYINGEWRESSSKESISILSPYLREEIGHVQAISQDEVDEAINGAKLAQKEWSQLSVRARGEYLYRWANELLAMKNEIAQSIMEEVGKTFNDAVKEVERTADFIQYTIEEATHMQGESMLGEKFPRGKSL